MQNHRKMVDRYQKSKRVRQTPSNVPGAPGGDSFTPYGGGGPGVQYPGSSTPAPGGGAVQQPNNFPGAPGGPPQGGGQPGYAVQPPAPGKGGGGGRMPQPAPGGGGFPSPNPGGGAERKPMPIGSGNDGRDRLGNRMKKQAMKRDAKLKAAEGKPQKQERIARRFDNRMNNMQQNFHNQQQGM